MNEVPLNGNWPNYLGTIPTKVHVCMSAKYTKFYLTDQGMLRNNCLTRITRTGIQKSRTKFFIEELKKKR